MDIYLMRHGAQMAKELDPSEPLSEQGKKQIAFTASVLKKEGILLDGLAASPKMRAKQSAEILANTVDYSIDQIIEDARLKPLTPVEEALELLATLGNRILIVGHLPLLQNIASFLLTTGAMINLNFQCGSCAKISIDHINNRNGSLIYLFSSDVFN
ncbi:MAG: phosphohistidine phosphatase SixA [Candidatus Algichlamydia australiensis]|nr:phosphohistidine phosphatase SixA [Chlamydiales bacterium]